MSKTDRDKRDDEIVELFKRGERPNAIGRRYGIHGERVRTILKLRGIELDNTRVAAIWEREGADLRAAIAKRASAGARKRLNEIAVEQEAHEVIHTNFHNSQTPLTPSSAEVAQGSEALQTLQ